MIKFTTWLFFSFVAGICWANSPINVSDQALKRMKISQIQIAENNALIPLSAILFLNNETYVYVKNEKGFLKVKVEVEPGSEASHLSEHLHQGRAHLPQWRVNFDKFTSPVTLAGDRVQFLYLEEELSKQ